MKWMRNILFLLVLFALFVVELSAQTRSSAAQVVTFGVRRIDLQAPNTSFAASALVQSPPKVTVGAESQVQSAVDLRVTGSGQTFSSDRPVLTTAAINPQPARASREPNFRNANTPFTALKSSGKLIVTLTE
jgi:hypothetical protein